MAKAHEIPGLSGQAPWIETAREVVRVRAEELFAHADGVLDTSDIERVHDMRVATRRLRAVLETFGGAFPKEELRPVLRDVKALADALGARRDPDVAIASLLAFAGAVPAADRAGAESLAAALREEQEVGNETLARALEEAREHDLRGRLDALVAGDGEA